MSAAILDFGLLQRELSVLNLVVCGVIAYVLWRLWRFTVRPFFDPDSPREVPYFIPFAGHAISMLRNPHDLLSFAIKYCKGSGEPVAINVFGQTIYFILSEQDATAVLREPPQVSHKEHLKSLLMGLGCSELGISEMDHDSQPKAPALVLVAEEFMRKQLLERSLSTELLARSLEVLESHVRWDAINAPTLLRTSEDEQERTVSLWKWAQTAIIRAVATAWFGDSIWNLSPSIVEDLVCLEMDLWKLLFKLPQPCGKKVRAARARMRRCLIEYMRLPPSSQSDQCWAVKNAVPEMRRRRLSEDDMASYLLMVLWGSNANIFKLGFWLLAHICSDQATLTAVVAEVDAIISASNHAQESLSALSMRLEQNPLLEALYNETQRLTINSGSARTVEQDVTINGRTFKAGAHLLIPYRQLAMSHPLLAQDWDRFQPDRFLSNPTLAHSKSFLPFGAGKHKCVGRFLTKRLALTFTALVVHRFTVSPLDELPAIEFTPVTSGPGGPVGGNDMQLVISQRDVLS
ncbi:cytochrome P450 [Aspergillus pseudotamarii]|uniref:Cytochrome P450 n=1 Tax=Aspergillus pseudotamarii TaxID=132259 RepID=A0A5N6SDG8_ASPPS|nr:cytochrome P450 [Aspergillus pseudotamarii]KAE8131909.1 cytochrome P450 [Aspergillus pseudotamarii]